MSAPREAPVKVRRLVSSDVSRVGDILYRSFNRVFATHGYPPPIPDLKSGRLLAQAYHDYEPESCFVALDGEEVIGSVFVHRRGDRAGVGPVTVDPEYQGRRVGRRLMRRALDEVADCASVRLYQDAFNRESFALYAALGFNVRDVMGILRASPASFSAIPRVKGRTPRPMEIHELDAVARCDTDLTGLVRPDDLVFLYDRGPSCVLETDGRIAGYAVSFQVGETLFVGPAAAGDVDDLMRLIAAVCTDTKPESVTLRAPARPGDLFRALMRSGFNIRSLGTYMVRGAYAEPGGVSLSALFPETL